VIFGAGGLGLMALSLLKAMGGKGAIVVDIDARKREAAEKAGDNAKAREYYRQVVAIAANADKTRTEIADARAHLEKL